MKEIINLQINAFGYDIARNSGIKGTLGYDNDHNNEKEALDAINGVRQHVILSHKPLVPSFQQ